jgi:MarR family transcriptional regulator, 2-MHQ and catechol-resistance regulon repressor
MVPEGAALDFGSAEAVLIARLFDHPEGRTITQLTASTGFVQSRVSTVVARLQHRGWVALETDPMDRRRTVARLATHVKERIAEAFTHPADRALDELLHGLQAADRARVTDALTLLAERLRREEGDAIPIRRSPARPLIRRAAGDRAEV